MQTIARKITRHGMVYSPEWAAWARMKVRCLNPNNKTYALYGGRGITVAPEWVHSFEAFLTEVGPRPSRLHSLDRINTNGNYEPGNVRWATAGQQANNRRTNHLITYEGRTQTMAEWAIELGLTGSAVERRINLLGWSTDRALSTPIGA